MIKRTFFLSPYKIINLQDAVTNLTPPSSPSPLPLPLPQTCQLYGRLSDVHLKKYMLWLSLPVTQKLVFHFFLVVFGQIGKRFLRIFESLLHRTSVTSTGQFSLDRLKKACTRHFFHSLFSMRVTNNMLYALTNLW